MELDEFAAQLAQLLGVPADAVDIPAILDLAREAAHGLVRPAAPVAAYLAGYARVSAGQSTAAHIKRVHALVDEVLGAAK